MKIQFYLLRAFTNLHVGNGETNFGVIDNLIERDPVTGFPCINSSGLKGAIKQQLARNKVKGEDLKTIFGSDVNRNQKDKTNQNSGQNPKDNETCQGSCSFLPAYLLAIPIRSNKTPFVLTTCPQMIRQFLNLWKDLHGQECPQKKVLEKFIDLIKKESDAYILPDLYSTGTVIDYSHFDLGGFGLSIENLPNYFDKDSISMIRRWFKGILSGSESTNSQEAGMIHPIGIISDAMMLKVCDDMNLPVIARNVLENGESQNLWYEQVLPRESLLFFAVIWGNEEQLKTAACMEQNFLQVGANASVGYGLTRIKKFS